MAEHSTKLREIAIAAYEASDLKQKDLERNRESASRIKQLLSRLGIDIQVDSNLLEIEGIRFYARPCEDQDKIYGCRVMVSRRCSNCGERIILEVADYTFERYNAAVFGQWLQEPHPCEFSNDKEESKRIGF